MRIPRYHVDAFTGERFRGNPAAVCLLDSWLPDEVMLAIAAENRHSETAFVVPSGAEYELRWFTPTVEVSLCGRATLATAHVLLAEAGQPGPAPALSEPLGPAHPDPRGPAPRRRFSRPHERPLPHAGGPCARWAALPSRCARPAATWPSSPRKLTSWPCNPTCRPWPCSTPAPMVTAPGDDVDFVSRFFVPKVGAPEDPVTGSAHCTLVPYWSARLGKRALTARQLSARGGELWCEDCGERLHIGGQAVTYLRGELEL